MKTATIRTYHIFGTRNSYSADVFYRGRLLKEFQGNNEKENVQRAIDWAISNGFTHHKITVN